MLNGLLTKARVYDFRALVDSQGQMFPDADVRMSYDKTDRHARPIIICTEPIEEALSLAKRVHLSPDLIPTSFFTRANAVEVRDPLNLRKEDFLTLSQYLHALGILRVEAYIASSLNNVLAANAANVELRKLGVRKEGHIYFPKIGLINPLNTGLEASIRPGGPGSTILYQPLSRLMQHF